ncbi:uncharacterized protein [Pempheris klunzingeri]|uniref:uncharacterized protein isoform X2 n=1 Tax=Pempheris klunzingeri TaxID=3127111 RepID=UPI0039813E5F
MSKRRCIIGGCHETNISLHNLPKDRNIRDQWLMFIFSKIPQDFSPKLGVCSAHFSSDCFINQAQFNAGFAKKLLIRDTAVPTLLGPASDPRPGTGASGCRVFPAVRHVASQTDPPERKSVSTQLSMKTLQNHFRSTGTQVKVPSRDCGVCTLTFPLDSPLLFLQPTIVKRPSKRPRLSLTEEEEGPSECSLSMVVHEPEDST